MPFAPKGEAIREQKGEYLRERRETVKACRKS